MVLFVFPPFPFFEDWIMGLHVLQTGSAKPARNEKETEEKLRKTHGVLILIAELSRNIQPDDRNNSKSNLTINLDMLGHRFPNLR